MKKFIFLSLLFPAILLGDNISLIVQKIKNQYENFYKDYHIQIQSVTPYFTQDSKINEVKIKNIHFLDSSLPSHSSLKLDFSYQNQTFSQVLNFDVKATVDAIYAKVNIKKNQNIASELVYIKSIPLSDLKSPILSQKDLDKISAKVQIPANTLITIYQGIGRILIRKNEPFMATYRDGGILIQTTLIAKQDGRKNDIIEAINPESQKVIRVRVLEDGNGEIL